MKLNHPLITKLKSLNLPAEDYVIFASGPMYAHGLKDLSHDLDLVARGKAWKKACSINKPVDCSIGNGQVVELFDGEIEIFNSWEPGEWNIDELIDNADIVDGIRFGKLTDVLRWKRLMARPKDLEHIKLIENYLERK